MLELGCENATVGTNGLMPGGSREVQVRVSEFFLFYFSCGE